MPEYDKGLKKYTICSGTEGFIKEYVPVVFGGGNRAY